MKNMPDLGGIDHIERDTRSASRKNHP